MEEGEQGSAASGAARREVVRWALAPVGAAVLLALAVAASSFFTVRATEEATGDLLVHYVGTLVSASELERIALSKAAANRGFLVSGDESYLRDIAEERLEFDRRLEGLRSLTRTDAGRSLDQQVVRAELHYREAVDDLVQLRRRPDEAGALRWFSTDVQPRSVALQQVLNAYVLHKEELLAEEATRVIAAGRRAARLALAGSVVAVVLTAGLGWVFGGALYRRVQQMRNTTVAAQRSAELRDEVIQIASHDLRTPLSTLVLHLDALHLDLSRRKLDDPDVRRRLGAARRQVDNQVQLLDRLLDVSRIEAGKLDLRLEDSVDLTALARRVMDRLAPQAERAGIELRLASEPSAVVGTWDPTRLEQVIGNLLSNAIKFSAKRPVEVRVRGASDEAELHVRDAGPGMSEEQKQAIFERFETAATRGGPGGAGLGLWISRRVVEALGGRIEVDSRPGEGTEFTVCLPRAPR